MVAPPICPNPKASVEQMPADLQSLERAARESLAAAYGHPLSDAEWTSAKYALLEFAKLARDWNPQADERVA
jgi:hypothetical protein